MEGFLHEPSIAYLNGYVKSGWLDIDTGVCYTKYYEVCQRNGNLRVMQGHGMAHCSVKPCSPEIAGFNSLSDH